MALSIEGEPYRPLGFSAILDDDEEEEEDEDDDDEETVEEDSIDEVEDV